MAGPSRRERVRDATTAEIKATARSLLVEEGTDAVTLREIARRMGMTAPALYRYFDGHEELVGALVADLLAELTEELAAARDTVPVGDPLARLGQTCRAFRRWSLAHPREFQLTFASPVPHEHDHPVLDATVEERLSFGAVFLGIFVEIWERHPFPVLPADAMDPTLRGQLAAFGASVGDVLPVGALAVWLAGWVRLYGAVTIEVFGHIGFALADAEPLFEQMLRDMRAGLLPADTQQ
jgi:AcrR family transcriptional regulator